ncbi:MAG TPA: lactonase family protein [Candidatus Acidoferrales bacterium]|jgi:6-phosphogluconolactonase|nr:lactonase family protein [Candidatus Acidoferrales bacterium]
MKIIRYACLVFAAVLPALLAAPRPQGANQGAKRVPSKGELLVYVGTYTRQDSKGIYAYRFQPSTGKLTSIGLVAETENPSFLALHPNHRFLYAVNEISNYEGQSAGSVSSFSIEVKTGMLTALNKVTTRGTIPAHLVVDKTGKSLIVANYGSGSVAAFPLNADGSVGRASAFVQHSGSSTGPRQRGPHAHAVSLSPDNRFVFVPDLGLDQVLSYRLDAAKSMLTPNDPPFTKVTQGSGPRHFVFHPDGKFAYTLSEMGSLVTVFAYDHTGGTLKELQTISTLPKDFSGTNNSAELQVHPNGRFLYASNRGHDSIAVFAIDPRARTLTLVEHVPTRGKMPRNFAIDPTGAYLLAANQNTNNIVLFRIARTTGRLTPTGDDLKTPSPVCIIFLLAR